MFFGNVVAKSGVARTKILLLLFVDTGSKWEETVKSSGALHSPRQRVAAVIGGEGTPGAQRGAGIGCGWKLSSYQRRCHSSARTEQGSRFTKSTTMAESLRALFNYQKNKKTTPNLPMCWVNYLLGGKWSNQTVTDDVYLVNSRSAK